MSEKLIAKSIGAQLVTNSGRGFRKGDMLWEWFVVDAKEGLSFSFNENAWRKVCSDTMTYGLDRSPMILRVMPGGSRIACIQFEELKNIIGEITKNHSG